MEFVSNVYQAGDKKVIQCNIRDIAERKRAEESHARMAAIVESSEDAIIGKNPDGIITTWNKGAQKVFGYAPGEIVGTSIMRLVPAGLQDEEDQILRRVMRGEAVEHFETRRQTKDGRLIHVSIVVSPIKDASGNVIGASKVARDITERKRAEESHARLAMAVEQAAETVVITDPQGAILYANPVFEKTSGYTCAEVLGQNPRIIKSGKHDAEFYRRMWETLKRGENWRGHFVNKRKDGKLFEEDATISPVRDAAGTIVNYVAVKRDVTHEMQLEAQFRQAQKMEAVGTLAGGVAHDFNNILAALFLQTDFIGAVENLPAEVTDGLQQIRADAERAAKLVRQLLLFSRRQVFQPRDLDLGESITSMSKMLNRILGENINKRYTLAAQPMFIHADAGMMDQVLMNLAVNARDAMPDGGQLVIEISGVEFDEFAAAQSAQARPGSFVCLSVSDTGCGIPAEILPKIFDPFFTTKDVGKGTGLGLATVFGIVQQHDGWINVHSEVGHGTTFRIYLPRLTGMPAQKAAPPALTAMRGGNETILLVEDEQSLRVIMRTALTRLGYRVLEAPTGVKALEVWKDHRKEINLVLTDLLMPDGMTGKDLAQRLLQENPKLKVVYMSGYSADVVGKDFPLKKGISFLAKPFEAHKLAQTIRDSLDKTSS